MYAYIFRKSMIAEVSECRPLDTNALNVIKDEIVNLKQKIENLHDETANQFNQLAIKSRLSSSHQSRGILIAEV